MKTIRNKTANPIRVHLPGGKVLHLAPFKTGQVADGATEQSSLKRLVAAGEVEIVGEGGSPDAAGDAATPKHGSKHGHQPSTIVHRRGDR
jgi:hypothetical protein